jgi:hypothetical protein
MRRFTKIIDLLFEAVLYKYWISLSKNMFELRTRMMAIFHPLDGFYSFELYHMQPAVYLLLIGRCLSALCFRVELFYNRVLRKRN